MKKVLFKAIIVLCSVYAIAATVCAREMLIFLLEESDSAAITIFGYIASLILAVATAMAAASELSNEN